MDGSAGTMADEAHAECKNIFNLVDVNHDAFVSREEWTDAFAKIDIDGDGVISRKDWMLRNGSSEIYDKVSKKVKGILNKRERISAFDALDQNGDGFVSLIEWLTQTIEGQLAAGWVVGDKVVSQIAYDALQVGDHGEVEGPCRSQIEDAAQRVCVDFKGKGLFNAAASHIEAAPICHGYAKFDLILSRVDHNDIKMGDPGIVVGPSSSGGAADFADSVRVNFGPGKGLVNFLATTQIEGIPLAGNYEKGDMVFSKIKFGKVKVGDQGTVIGPPQNPEDALKFVRISFGAKGCKEMSAVSHIYGPYLALGYRKGDKVQSKISHEDWVKPGDYGIVTGPCTSNGEDKANCVQVAFGEDRRRVNMLGTTQIEPAPLAGGWFRGDTAISTINSNKLQIGMKGLVLGPTSSPKHADAAQRLSVDFGSPAGIENILITQVKGESRPRSTLENWAVQKADFERAHVPIRGLLMNKIKVLAYAPAAARPDPVLLPKSGIRKQAELPPPYWSLTIDQFLNFLKACMATATWERLKAVKGEEKINMHDVDTHFIIPWTKGTGCSVALLMNQTGRKAELMLSHAWQGSVIETLSSVSRLPHSGQDPDKAGEIYVFFCAFSQYQPNDGVLGGLSVQEQLDKGPFKAVIGSGLSYGMYVIHTSLTDVYSRLWCVSEVFYAMSLTHFGIGGLIRLPDEEHPHAAFHAKAESKLLTLSFSTSEAKTSTEKDKTDLTEEIEKMAASNQWIVR